MHLIELVQYYCVVDSMSFYTSIHVVASLNNLLFLNDCLELQNFKIVQKWKPNLTAEQ